MIPLKTKAELDIMRENGRLLARVLREVCSEVAPGVSTASLDRRAEEMILSAGAKPAFKGYRGFPATLCTSINDEIVHGIPSEKRLLRNGDILSIDIGLVRNGYFADMATTVPVGEISAGTRKILEVGKRSLWEGIKQVRIGHRLSDISHAIGSFVEKAGYYVVREYVGHGIGRALHEEPEVPNYGPPGRGVRLRAGMTLAIEPMVKTDDLPTKKVKGDPWTVKTASGGLSVHFEHTVALTEDGPEVLTDGGDSGRSGS